MGINTHLSPLSRRAETDSKTNRQDPDRKISTVELDDELYNLDSRIFKRDITPVTSHISYVVLLPKD